MSAEDAPPIALDLGLYLHEHGGRERLGWGKTPFLQPAELVAIVEGLYTGYLQLVPSTPHRNRVDASPLHEITHALEGRPRREHR